MVVGEECGLEIEDVRFLQLDGVGVTEKLAWGLDRELATTAGRRAVLAASGIDSGIDTNRLNIRFFLNGHVSLQMEGEDIPTPRCFFVRVASKGLMVDAARKSGKYKT